MRLVVDGYNMIHAWKDLRPLLDVSLEEAREVLIERLGVFALVDGMEVTVVFDAHRRPDSRASEQERGGVRVLFSGGRSADHVIERLAYLARDADELLTVATSDGFQRALVRGMGMPVIDAAELEQRVLAAEAELARRVRQYGR